ncbi:TetR/AcrR family transcriptional regulator [Frondihabitans cladoniiphilus]|uniref:TetR/AcrR family transcriptional regulator n=1 Tax=Frondihabitans cladoniiphilus TaxID=715785 RepID=A0ABP8W4G9_9MICO
MTVEQTAARPVGRRRDPERDAAIVQATLDVLAETGYEGMTVDMVASRAKAGKATLYRRWPSKAHLVVGAIASLTETNVTLSDVPDSGSFTADLATMKKASGHSNIGLKMQILAGLTPSLASDPELAAIIREQLIAPRTTLMRGLLLRAVERGEIAPDRDLDALALIVPSMMFYRCAVLGQPVTLESHQSLIDEILLPAVGLRP